MGVVAEQRHGSLVNWKPVVRDLLVGGAGFAIGAFPLLLYNIQTPRYLLGSPGKSYEHDSARSG